MLEVIKEMIPNYHCRKCGEPFYIAGYYNHREKYDGSKTHISYECHKCGHKNPAKLEPRETDHAE